jgi:hypothetical protein
MTSSDSDLIGRLLEQPIADTPPPPCGAQSHPLGATAPTLESEDWDEKLARRPVSETVAQRSLELRRMGRLGVFALAVVGGLAGLGIVWIHVMSDPLADVRAYYDAATRLNIGLPLYPAGADPNVAGFYRYPPLLAMVLRPFAAALPYPVFAFGWEALILVSFGLLLRHLGLRSPQTWLAVGLLGIPIGWALAIGQAQIPMTLLIAIGQPWSIAVATNLKLFPALVALWWLGRRNYQAVGAFVVWTGLLGLVQLLLDPSSTGAFLGSVGLEEIGQVRNISPYAAAPLVWAVLAVAGVLAALRLARTRWGWALAVGVATLASPRLLVYMLGSLIAAVREPVEAGAPEPEPVRWRGRSARW